MSLSRFIAQRIYSSRDNKQKVSRPAVVIAMLGVCVGVVVMIISIAVVFGFKNEVTSKVVGFNNDVQVLSLMQNERGELLPVITNDSLRNVVESAGGIRHIEEFAIKVGMIKTDEDFRAVQFNGVGEDFDLSFFKTYLREGKIPKFSSKESSNKIVVSRKIATDLSLHVGDKVYTYFVNETSMRARRLEVSGIYETNLSDYDKSIVLTDIYTVRRLNGWSDDESSGFHVSVNDFNNVDFVVNRLVSLVNHNYDRNGCTYGAFSVKDVAPSIFAWLSVLDTNVILILVLMLCVSTFTIMSGLLIVMLERINMIGMLKALGTSNFTIRKIFMHFSIRVVGEGLLLGNVVALALCWFQWQFHVLHLDASVYYINYVPVKFEWLMFLGVDILTLIISCFVIFGSSFFMSIGKPAQTMKFE
ncbi:MAG: ABC transporter permease [Bacteroidaceae bacterium]|nr:ABC transporter permease [Bacteroidaceae bacterium]